MGNCGGSEGQSDKMEKDQMTQTRLEEEKYIYIYIMYIQMFGLK